LVALHWRIVGMLGRYLQRGGSGKLIDDIAGKALVATEPKPTPDERDALLRAA